MKKIFLLGALVASTMAFASMESNSVLDTLKSGSVTVKGGLIFDGNSKGSMKYTVNPQPTDAGDKAYATNNFVDTDSVSLPSVGAGLEVEYSVPVYNINDDMSVLVAGGLQGGAGFSLMENEYKAYMFDKNNTGEKKVKEETESKKRNIVYVSSNISAFVAPKFEYKINNEMKVAAGVKLGLGAEIHSRLADNSIAKSIDTANAEANSANSKGTELDPTTKKEAIKKDIMGETNTTFAVPVAAIVDFDYNNIVASLDLGGKVLFANDKDDFSKNTTQEVKYSKDETSNDKKFVKQTPVNSSKFIFSAGLKVGYRFDLDKFMK